MATAIADRPFRRLRRLPWRQALCLVPLTAVAGWVALVTAGAPVTGATSAVLAYRIITVWLPLLPGALVLGALVRWKVV